MVIRALSEELRRKAETELNETPGRIEKDLKHIREWLEKQPHLHVRDDDQWLLAFLRGCKFSLQKVKEKIDCFYTVRSLTPEFFDNRDPFRPEIQELLKAGSVLPLPKPKAYTGPRVVLFNCSTFNFATMTFENIFKVFTMIADVLMLEDDDSTVSGLSVVVDYKGLSASYLPQFTPHFIKRTVAVGKDMYPLRNKNIFFINSPAIFQSGFQLIKLFLSNKLRERMFIYNEGGLDKICDHISKEVLPREIGGSGSSVEDIAAYWKEKIESYREWFIENEKYRSDESKRTDSSKIVEDLYGVEGSFRKLDID